MNKKSPYVVDYGKQKRKPYGFFRFLILALLVVFGLAFFNNQFKFNKDNVVTTINGVTNHNDQLDKLKKEIDQSQLYRDEISLLKKEISDLKNKLEDSKNSSSNSVLLAADQINEIRDLKGQIQSLNKLNDTLMEQNSILLKSAEDSKNSSSSSVSLVADQINEIRDLKGQIQSLNKLNDTLMEQNSILLTASEESDIVEDIKINPLNVNENKNTTLDNIQKKIVSSKPQIIKRINPRYPSRALQRRLSGSVKMIFDVDINGQAQNIRVLESSSYLFESEARRAVSATKFNPARDSLGNPIYFKDHTTIYEFNLK